MPLFRPQGSEIYVAMCEMCEEESGQLSNNVEVAVYNLLDHGWIVYDDYETTFCSEICLDNFEIDHIEEVIEVSDE
jgi:hypothetical protein